MSKQVLHQGLQSPLLASSGLALAIVALVGPTIWAGGGPVDAPVSHEPRVAVGKVLSNGGLWASEGLHDAYFRVKKDDTVYSRDLVVALPGFKADIEPASKGVGLTLWGNLPGLSDSPVRESCVILHDSKAYDLDLTLLRGRIVLKNQKKKGDARVWLRTESAGVQIVLHAPGDSVALEIYGRWPAGVPFSAKRGVTTGPIRLWEVYCLEGNVELKAGRTAWNMSAPPGVAYFHGDSVHGPAASGPERRTSLPAWADPKTADSPLAKTIRAVISTYEGKIKGKHPEDVAAELFAASLKDKDLVRARVTRMLIVQAMAALDEIDRLATLLGTSKLHDVRQDAVIALRHWIGAREGRDAILHEILRDHMHYTKAEAETIMQMLHSPFVREQPETYETLIIYLKHRKQAIRELAHWHLVRLAGIGHDITFDACDADCCEKAAAAWKKLIPSGELPKEKKDETKEK